MSDGLDGFTPYEPWHPISITEQLQVGPKYCHLEPAAGIKTPRNSVDIGLMTTQRRHLQACEVKEKDGGVEPKRTQHDLVLRTKPCSNKDEGHQSSNIM